MSELEILTTDTAQKLKFSIKDFFSKGDQIRRKLRIWSHLPKKSLMENFIFCAMIFVYPILHWEDIVKKMSKMGGSEIYKKDDCLWKGI